MLKPHALAKATKQIAKHFYEIEPAARKKALKVYSELTKVPQEEYSKITDLNIGRYAQPEGRRLHGFYANPATEQFKPSSVHLDIRYAKPTTPWHEFTHARQRFGASFSPNEEIAESIWNRKTPEQMEKALLEANSALALRKVDLLLGSPYAQQLIERHARSVEVVQQMRGRPFTRVYTTVLKILIKRLRESPDILKRAGVDLNDIYGVIAASGATAALLASPDEAEAMPRGVFTKMSKKAASKVRQAVKSSASSVLEGEMIQGKVITEVRKGKGKFRSIIFDDGTRMTVDKQDITNLCRSKGTQRYIKAFQEKQEEQQVEQAFKSMSYHEARARTFQTREQLRRYHADYLKTLKEMGKELPPETVFVSRGNKFYQMPMQYAEMLERLGVLKIERTKKNLEILKRYRRQ